MNLVSIYKTQHEFKPNLHVVAVSDFAYQYSEKNIINIKKGLNGKIISIDREKNLLTIYCENDCCLEDVSPIYFTLRNELSPSDAKKRLESFFGHHTGPYNQHLYQFNVKMYDYDIPGKVIDSLGQDYVWDTIYHLEQYLFYDFVGETYDEAPLSFFKWIGEYYLAGRSGGYLILKDNYHTLQSYEETYYHYKDLIAENYDFDYIELYRKELKEAESELIERAYDLEMIQTLIKKYQDYHFNDVNSVEFWSEYAKENCISLQV